MNFVSASKQLRGSILNEITGFHYSQGERKFLGDLMGVTSDFHNPSCCSSTARGGEPAANLGKKLGKVSAERVPKTPFDSM